MKLAVGKKYLDYSGEVVEIIGFDFSNPLPFTGSNGYRYNLGGLGYGFGHLNELDKEIKPKKVSEKKFDKEVQSIFAEDDGNIAWNTFDELRSKLFGGDVRYNGE